MHFYSFLIISNSFLLAFLLVIIMLLFVDLAQVEVDRAEQVAEPLLSFASAALAANQAAAEATATPKAKANNSLEKKDKEEKRFSKELPTPEVDLCDGLKT